MKQQRASRTLGVVLAIAGAGILILVIATAVIFSKYTSAAGRLIPRGEEMLDMRGETLTPEEYAELHASLPECRILWNVPFQSGEYASDSVTLTIRDPADRDMEMLTCFSELEVLDARECTDYAALARLMSAYPELGCQLTLAGQSITNDVETLRVEDASLQELRGVLPLLRKLERLELAGILPADAELQQLQLDYPGVLILWEIPAGNQTVMNNITTLDLSSRELDYASTEALLRRLPLLEQVDMRGCGLTDAEMIRLSQSFPQTLLLWDMEVAGLRFPTDSVEIDISGQKVSDPGEVESLLSCFPRLERVIMSDCGLDNETMDALNRRHEDVRFVWTVYFRWWPVRTDALYFYPYKMDHRFPFEDEFGDVELYPLRYCTDMVSIDLGHDGSVYTIEWAAFMPKLRYLILTECPVTDLTPLVNCKELVYLEMTKCWWEKDLSPLVECTALEDLNLGWSYPDPEPISHMPWLKHIWWCSAKATSGLPCSTADVLFAETLPNTITFFDGAHPVDGGWRELQTYYDMRDLMVMYYLR